MTRKQRLAWYDVVLGKAFALGAEHYVEAQRHLIRTDLFYLLIFPLNRRDLNRDWLFDRCNEVQAEPDERLDLWAREHGKSSIITFGKTIQDILIDPEITVGIFSHTRPIAKGFLRTIKNEFQNNVELKALFPEILFDDPEAQAPNWSEDTGITVKRTGNPKESTVEAWGLVEGMPTSKHFALMVYDDIIDQKSVTNPDMIRKVTEAWEMSLSLGKVGGRTRYIGTRYHFADPYREMMARGVRPRIYPCTREGTWPGTPVLMPATVLAEKRRKMGVYTFGSQLLQDPTADKQQGFKREWLRYYPGRVTGDGMTKYLLCDPANAKKRESDYTTMGVIGLGTDENYYLLDGIRDRLNLTERGEALFELHRRWRPNGVGYEQYGMQSDIQYFEAQMADQEYRFEITPLGGQLAKADRIRKMVPIFEAGRFFLPEQLLKTDYEGRVIDIIQSFIEEEYVAFPVGLHEDFFDMLARIEDEALGVTWPKSAVKEDRYAAPKHRKNRARSAWAA
jgi:phage terminase large subunit-like protein